MIWLTEMIECILGGLADNLYNHPITPEDFWCGKRYVEWCESGRW